MPLSSSSKIFEGSIRVTLDYGMLSGQIDALIGKRFARVGGAHELHGLSIPRSGILDVAVAECFPVASVVREGVDRGLASLGCKFAEVPTALAYAPGFFERQVTLPPQQQRRAVVFFRSTVDAQLSYLMYYVDAALRTWLIVRPNALLATWGPHDCFLVVPK